MTFPRRRNRPRFNGNSADHAATELLRAVGDNPAAPDPQPLAQLRAEPRYTPADIPEPIAPPHRRPPAPDMFPALQEPIPEWEQELLRKQAEAPQQQAPPATGYADTTGPMPAIGRPAISIGDALTRDDQWGPKLTPLPCGHCGTPPEIPDSITDRTRIIGHVNWLARQAGWTYDTDIIWTCPPCQQDDEWKARQGQLEVQWPDGAYCYRHGANDPDAYCTCPATVIAVDVMLAAENYLGSPANRAAAS